MLSGIPTLELRYFKFRYDLKIGCDQGRQRINIIEKTDFR